MIKLLRIRKWKSEKSRFRELQRTVDCLWRKSTDQKKIVDVSTRKRKKIDKEKKRWSLIKDRRWRDFVLFSEFFYKKDFFI